VNAAELLREVASGRSPGVVRVHRPGPTAAFGRLDRLRDGYVAAQEAARRHGFEPILREGGGHAVVYDQRSVVVDEITPSGDIAAGIQDRFASGTARIVTALESLGLAPQVGELPGEYCAGAHSVSLDGRVKIAGTAQRVVRGAALFSAVVLVGGGGAIRAALGGIYAALDLDWEPSTAGAIQDLAPHVTPEAVERALAAAFARDRRL
jgi:octanoyl-[GcvH]:protein N-octanoyltransferase